MKTGGGEFEARPTAQEGSQVLDRLGMEHWQRAF